MSDTWEELQTPLFRFKNLGRPAVFLIPVSKLGHQYDGVITVGAELHRFLMKEFGAFHYTETSNAGFWTDHEASVFHDECRVYEVSFSGKMRITMLAEKLAELCDLMEEKSIYFKAGQYAALIYPTKNP